MENGIIIAGITTGRIIIDKLIGRYPCGGESPFS
jgi:hypothetical protein